MRTELGLVAFALFVMLAHPDDPSQAQDVRSQEAVRKKGWSVADVPERYRTAFGILARDDRIEEVRQGLPYDSISLERTPCFGNCPVYKVVFRRNGEAELHVVAYSNLSEGDYVGRLSTRQYARLCYAIEQIHFHDMDHEIRANWTDDTTCIVSVAKGDDVTSISDYGAVGPNELWIFQEAMDGVRERVKWKAKE